MVKSFLMESINRQSKDFENLRAAYWSFYRAKFNRRVVDMISLWRAEQRADDGRDFAIDSIDEMSDSKLKAAWSPNSILKAFNINPLKVMSLSEISQQAEMVWKAVQNFRTFYSGQISKEYERRLLDFEMDAENYIVGS
jgi:hypothetical protein